MLLLQPLSLLSPWESCLGLLSVAARGKVKGADKYVLESMWLQSQNLSMRRYLPPPKACGRKNPHFPLLKAEALPSFKGYHCRYLQGGDPGGGVAGCMCSAVL